MLILRPLNFVKYDQGSFSFLIFQKIGTRFSKLPTDTDQLFNYGNKINLKKCGCGSCFVVCVLASFIRALFSQSLHCSKDSASPEQIERHLPEENINRIPGHPGKPGTECIVVQMA